MALAPTLYLERVISVAVGAVSIAGLIATMETEQRAPMTGLVSVVGQAPTISVQLGPTSDPEVGESVLVGQIPFLLRILNITTGLPDAAAEQNDLTPTLVWQETALPTKATLTITGQIPAIIGDGGQRIFPGVGLAVISNLALTLDVPAGQVGAVAPNRTEIVVLGLEPFITGQLAVSADRGELTIAGFVPNLLLTTGWETVPVVSGPTWNDVPRV